MPTGAAVLSEFEVSGLTDNKKDQKDGTVDNEYKQARKVELMQNVSSDSGVSSIPPPSLTIEAKTQPKKYKYDRKLFLNASKGA